MALSFIRGWLRHILSILFVALIVFVRPSPEVHAASITVNASCSLSDAITAANTDTATGGCAAGNGALDTISLSDGTSLLQSNCRALQARSR